MRSIKKYLYDIVRAIKQMREHTDGVTLEIYLREFDDQIIWNTVQQDLPILEGEVRKLPADSSIE